MAHLLSRRLHDPLAFAGRVEMWTVESEVLRTNALGDPHVRELPVYFPPGTPKNAVLYLLAGFTSRGQAFLSTDPWRPGVVQRLDRAIQAGEVPPVVVVLPDCFTKLGGSQYVNSSAVGRYADYVVDELIPLVDLELGPQSTRRGVLGKSSGGFGALHLAMQRPGTFPAVGSISGDCGFENTFGSEFLLCLRGLAAYEFEPARFLEDFHARPELTGDSHAVINVLAMAACYSPNSDAPLGFDLPFDLQTGERIPAVWDRWLAFDPIEIVGQHAPALERLRFLHIECGLQDEFHLQWGTRVLSRRLTELGVAHTHAEHSGGHRGIDRRFLELIPRMVRALDPAYG